MKKKTCQSGGRGGGGGWVSIEPTETISSVFSYPPPPHLSDSITIGKCDSCFILLVMYFAGVFLTIPVRCRINLQLIVRENGVGCGALTASRAHRTAFLAASRKLANTIFRKVLFNDIKNLVYPTHFDPPPLLCRGGWGYRDPVRLL